MYKKICISVMVGLLAAKAVCAFETGTLRGRLIDGFGKPINFANIAVVSNGSKTKTTSDATGVFSIDYNPGNLKLTFDKEGYVPLYVPLSLDEKTDLSVGDITLWKIPPKGGLFVVGDGDYIEINNAEYYSEASSKERCFYVKGSPTRIKGQEIKIIDFQTDNPLVVGKTLYNVDSKGSLGSIVFYPTQKVVTTNHFFLEYMSAKQVGM